MVAGAPHRQLVGYLSKTSYAAGEAIDVHVASGTVAACAVDIYRVVGSTPRFEPRLIHVARAHGVPVLTYGAHVEPGDRLGPGDADTNGCGWPAARLVDRVPGDWPSGIYVAQFTTERRPSGSLAPELGRDCMFVLRAARPGRTSSILVQVGVATWNAYHLWRGRSLYIGDVGDPTGRESAALRASTVSFARPGVGLAPTHNIPWWPPKARLYTPPFLEWLRSEGIEVEWCTGLDLDQGRVQLSNYRLVVTVGHDEYWTAPQRDAVERFVAEGGNAAFFGGNLAYWQIRSSESGARIECYKRVTDTIGSSDPSALLGRPLDPLYRDPELYPDHSENGLVTVEFGSPPVNRPTTSLTGVSMQHHSGISAGAAWWWENFGGPERPAKGFVVVEPDHWAFEGSGIRRGDEFGVEQKLVGYECDGRDVVWQGQDVPIPTGRDGQPAEVKILAYADCRDWAEVDYAASPPVRRPGQTVSAGALGGVVTLIEYVHPSGGTVFTAPVTDWTHSLVPTVEYTRYRAVSPPICPPDPVVQTVTRNVLRTLAGAVR